MSCSFEFSEDHYVELEQPLPNAMISVEPFEEGIVLASPRTVTYSFNGNGKHRLYSVNIQIDDTPILGSNDVSDSFTINTDALTEGEHVLKVTIQYSSGSRSLADLNDRERINQTIDYNFYVDKSSPETVSLNNIEVVDGSIFIRWNSIQKTNFDEAFLNVFDPENGRLIRQIELDTEIISNGIFNDTLSTELNLAYAIVLKNHYAQSESNRLGLTLEEPTFEGKIVSSSSYRIIWSEHPLYGNFDHYSYNVRPNNTFVQLSNRGGEYLVNDDPVFGQPEFHQLNLKRNDDETLFYVGDVLDFAQDFEAKSGVNYVYSEKTKSIFTVVLDGNSTFNAPRDVVIYELDAANLATIRSKNLFTIFDSSVNLVIDPISQNLILDLKDSSHLIDIVGLSIQESWNAEDYVSDTYNIKTAYRNGFLAIEQISGRQISIFDISTGNLVYQSNIEHLFFVADDGRTLINNEKVFRWQNNKFEPVSEIDKLGNVAPHEAIFIPDQNLVVYSDIYGHPVIYDYGNNSKTVITELEDIYRIVFDSTTNNLCFFKRDPNDYYLREAFLYNLISGLQKTLKVYGGRGSIYHYYLGGKLFSNQGLYLNHYFN
nr:hypothetical protein [Allomuricauda sp.]|tara:strand:+ start:60640 stop:62436 length:1797 start_codon:yes stop_codon:yes gene_type:complete